MRSSVFVGIPCYSNPAPEVLEDYMRFAYYLGRRYQDYDFFLGIKTKSEQFRARNAIVEGAYQIGADYILMMDDDHIIDTANENAPSVKYDFLRKLLNHLEENDDIGLVGALYYHRGGECRPVLMKEKEGVYVYLRDDEIKRGLQDVDVQGGGVMLIRSKVFDKIGVHPFEPEFEYGTDFQVCRKIKEAGWRICSDTSIEVGHLMNSRSIITGANRHMHYAETMERNDQAMASSRLGRIYREFRQDVKEYLGVQRDGALAEIANDYVRHQKSFVKYHADGRLKDYYIDAGPSYLARACFIRSETRPNPFDNTVLQVVRTEKPGVGIDFGCGSGPISFELARAGHQVYFYDIPGAVPFDFLQWRAKKYGIHGTTAMFVPHWPERQSCDYALFLDSLEHLENWKEVLTQAAGCLKHAGAVISNFMLLADNENREHIFMNKPEFMRYMTELYLWPINPAIFQKREDFQG
jgi:SAM-dependent methyltransferase